MDRALFELTPNPVLIYDRGSLQLLEANKAFLDKYGYKSQEVQDLSLFDLRPNVADKKLKNSLKQPADSESDEYEKHCAKDGSEFYVTVSHHPYENGIDDASLAFIYDITDRVIAERKAQKAYDELNHHVNHSPLAMIKWDDNYEIIEWSKRAKEITGYAKREVLGRTPDFFDFYDEGLESVRQDMNYLATGRRNRTHFETRMYHREGHLVDINVHSSALRDDKGKLVSVLTFIENVTEKKHTEIRYQRLFENANDGIFIMDGDQFIECNNQVLRIYGLSSKEDIIGKSPADFSPKYQPDGELSDEKAKQKVESALSGTPQVFEWQHKTLDGDPVDVEVSLNRLEMGDDEFVQAIVRDITEQKKAKEKLQRSEALFRKLFLKAPGAMVMIDPNNRVQKVNKSFEDLFGYAEEELLGKDIDQIIVGDKNDQIIPRMPDKGFEKDKFYTDIVRYSKSGKQLTLMLGAIPVYLDDEPIAGFGIYVDVTDRKKYEEQLQQSVKEKQVLLEEIHHRVKNNLAIISGMLQLQAFEAQNPDIKSALNDGQLRIQSIGIVHELLYQSEDFIDISFEEYIAKLIKTIRDTLPFEHQHIEVEVDTADVLLDINQAIPCAILINELVTNAYKHAFTEKQSGTIEISLQETAEMISIVVRDDGKGLPKRFSVEDQSSIGMNLIQTLTQQLEGTLDYHSESGTEFCIWFEKTKKKGSGNLYLVEG